jgi:hypothetical protein
MYNQMMQDDIVNAVMASIDDANTGTDFNASTDGVLTDLAGKALYKGGSVLGKGAAVMGKSGYEHMAKYGKKASEKASEMSKQASEKASEMSKKASEKAEKKLQHLNNKADQALASFDPKKVPLGEDGTNHSVVDFPVPRAGTASYINKTGRYFDHGGYMTSRGVYSSPVRGRCAHPHRCPVHGHTHRCPVHGGGGGGGGGGMF